MTKGRQSFTPVPASSAIYRAMNETIYQHIREATDPLLERAYPLFH